MFFLLSLHKHDIYVYTPSITFFFFSLVQPNIDGENDPLKISNERGITTLDRSIISHCFVNFIVCNTRIDDPRLHKYAIFHDEKGHKENVSLKTFLKLFFFFHHVYRVKRVKSRLKRKDGIKTILFLLFSYFFFFWKEEEKRIDFVVAKGDISERYITWSHRYYPPRKRSVVKTFLFFFFPASSTCVQTPIGWFRIPATLRPAARWWTVKISICDQILYFC